MSPMLILFTVCSSEQTPAYTTLQRALVHGLHCPRLVARLLELAPRAAERYISQRPPGLRRLSVPCTGGMCSWAHLSQTGILVLAGAVPFYRGRTRISARLKCVQELCAPVNSASILMLLDPGKCMFTGKQCMCQSRVTNIFVRVLFDFLRHLRFGKGFNRTLYTQAGRLQKQTGYLIAVKQSIAVYARLPSDTTLWF